MKFDKWVLMESLTEASYPKNIGIIEMVKFYKVASKSEVKEMEKIVERKDWDAFRELVKKVLGVELL